MTLKEFAGRLQEIYLTSARDIAHEKDNVCAGIPAAQQSSIASFCKQLQSTFSQKEMSETPVRKNAARLLHIFLLSVLNEPDEDWGVYKDLKDIYDCRICANAIAQVCVKGLMAPVTGNEFGSSDPFTDKEAEEVIRRIIKWTSVNI